MHSRGELYEGRKLADGYPGLAARALQSATDESAHLAEDAAGLERQMTYLGRLVDLEGKRVLVLGCGPRPEVVRFLVSRGHRAIGLEPVPLFVRAAREYLGSSDLVITGSAESIPLPDRSQQMVYCNGVMEHVDSPEASLHEMFRVLAPGGLAFIITTNRHKPLQYEFNVPLYNFLPGVVKESFVYLHLHYRPKLANYTERPAVHWYSYAELCRLGRAAGFAQFYSPLDLVDAHDPPVKSSVVKRALLTRVQQNAWLRALALTFTRFGGMVVMLKRPDSTNAVSVPPEAAQVSARVSAISPQVEPSADGIGGSERSLPAADGRPSHSA